MKKKPKRRIILWQKGEPVLYCIHQVGKTYYVVNGDWELLLDYPFGTVQKTGTTMKFDKLTDAPHTDRPNDYSRYNEILERARKEAVI